MTKLHSIPIIISLIILGINPMPVSARDLPQAIIADHRAVTEFDQIPSYWLEQAKLLTFHYAHTSHGSQIISGINALELVDPVYSVAVRESTTEGLPPLESPPALRIYDGNPPETYINPEDYWSSQSGIDRTLAVINTGNYNISGWSWCGQQSYNSVAVVQQYLDQMTSFESNYPDLYFIYMTGHTDGTQDNVVCDTYNQPVGCSPLRRDNQMVRDYVRDHNKVLYDFADIESWDPAGNYYTNTTDACTWCTTWCSQHPEDCQNLTTSCLHSHAYNCKLKAKAFWWLMARLAGWPGIQSNPNPIDLNQDSNVDFLDLSILFTHFNQPYPPFTLINIFNYNTLVSSL